MIFFFFKRKEQSGFTLIEILVVIAVVGILASMALVNTGKNPDRDLRQEAERLTTFLRDVQNMSLMVEQITSSEKVCGIGIHLESGSNPMYLQPFYVYTKAGGSFAKLDVDCGDDSIVSRRFDNKIEGFDAQNSVALSFGEVFYLRNSVEFDIDSPPDDIFFLIPHGKVYYGGSPVNDTNPARITLKKEGITVTITVKESGEISY